MKYKKPNDFMKLDIRGIKRLMNDAFKTRLENYQRNIHFYIPGMIHFETPYYKSSKPLKFPAISITGQTCMLNCEHCKGRILKKMIPAETPEKLYKICSKIKEDGGTGCLISGGSNKLGEVPLKKFLPIIDRVKRELKLEIVIHTGLVNKETVEGLAKADVDGILIEVIGSNETLKEIYHLKKTIRDLEEILDTLEEYNLPIIPHIVVGLHYGKIKGEFKALEMIINRKIAALSIVVIMPLPNTPMENIKPPALLEVSKILLAARLLKPKTPLLLGCARPRGLYKISIDNLSIKCGVNGIAYPSKEACETALKLGLRPIFHEKCCSLIWKDIMGAA